MLKSFNKLLVDRLMHNSLVKEASHTIPISPVPEPKPAPGLEIELYGSLDAIRDDWLELERTCLQSGYNSFHWLNAWLEHMAPLESAARPLFVVGRLNGATSFLLPLILYRRFGLTIARWMGECLNNQNTGLWTANILQNGNAERLIERLETTLRTAGVDMICLKNMPEDLGGLPYPLATSDGPTSANPLYAFKLENDFQALYARTRGSKARKKIRQKQRKLSELGTVLIRAETNLDARKRAVEATIENRRIRELKTGVPNAFHTTNHRDFLIKAFAAPERLGDVEPVVHVMWLNDDIQATVLGLIQQDRYYCYCTSIKTNEALAHSPGDVLLHAAIEDMCHRGLTWFDLGMGEEAFKKHWSEPAVLKDWVHPISSGGRVLAVYWDRKLRAKRILRNSPSFWENYKKARAILRKIGL